MEDWPQWETKPINPGCKNDDKEKKQITYEISAAQPKSENEIITSLFGIDESRYSSLKKLLRVTEYANRYIKHTKKDKNQHQRNSQLKRSIQQKYYGSDIYKESITSQRKDA